MVQPAPVSRSLVPTPAHVRAARNRRHWRNLLLDMRYQLRFTLVIVGISVVLTTGLGWLVYRFLRDASRVVSVRAMDPTDLEAIALQQQFLHYDHLLLLALVAFGLLLIAAMFAFGIVLTHKVAGPLYRVSYHLAAIRDGHMMRLGALRRGDQLHEFYTSYCRTQQMLEERTRQEVQVLTEVIGQLNLELAADAKPTLAEAQSRLRSLRDAKQRLLPD